MTLALALALVAACSSGPKEPVRPPPPAPQPTGDLPARMLRRLSQAAKCPSTTGEHRHWCLAADGWSGGTAADLPAGPTVLVGLSLGLLEEGSDEDALTDNVFLAAFGLGARDGKPTGLITDINPSGVDERKMTDDAMAQVAAVLKGKASVVTVAPPLREYLDQIPPAARHSLVKSETSWVLEGKARAEIRKVGDAWVALEQPTQGPSGLFVTIFTDKVAK